MDLQRLLTAYADDFERDSERHFNGVKTIREPLFSAMRYSFFSGGKRIRPVLFRLSHELYKPLGATARAFAIAIECIHTYSLIHDDLPCMDDDDFRRGKPSNHKTYGEGMAVLAGDALLNYAYELISGFADEQGVCAALRVLSAAAGAGGMVGGQALDIGAGSLSDLEYIHANKTAALFSASCVCGALLAGGDATPLREYGYNLGMLFQITDDLLDAETGGDADKITVSAVYGQEESRRRAAEYGRAAAAALRSVKGADHLIALCGLILKREA